MGKGKGVVILQMCIGPVGKNVLENQRKLLMNIFFLISAMALPGLSPLGHVLVQSDYKENKLEEDKQRGTISHI